MNLFYLTVLDLLFAPSLLRKEIIEITNHLPPTKRNNTPSGRVDFMYILPHLYHMNNIDTTESGTFVNITSAVPLDSFQGPCGFAHWLLKNNDIEIMEDVSSAFDLWIYLFNQIDDTRTWWDESRDCLHLLLYLDLRHWISNITKTLKINVAQAFFNTC